MILVSGREYLGPVSRVMRLRAHVPRSQARPPATNVTAIVDIVRAKLLAQGRLLIKDDKQMYSEGDRRHGCDRHRVGVSEDNPKPDPPGCEADVHRVSHIAVEPHHDQSLWRSHRCGRTLSRPPEVPNAAQGHCESEHRGHSRQPSPARCACCFHLEAEPPGQQPEPQREKGPRPPPAPPLSSAIDPQPKAFVASRSFILHRPSCRTPVLAPTAADIASIQTYLTLHFQHFILVFCLSATPACLYLPE